MLLLLEAGGALERAGVGAEDIAGTGPRWRVTAGADAADPAGFGDPNQPESELLARSPTGSVEIGLLRRAGEALPDVLRGRADALELLFEGEPSAADLYRDSPWSRAMNGLVSEAVSAAVSELPPGRRLRILEVGAGTGGTTERVLGSLPADRTDYLYTDISPGFFAAAQERFGGVGGASGGSLQFRALDIERDPEEQGFEPQGYDVVLAANVLHATRDLGESLAHCRALLAPSGLLVALETLAPQGWLDLTFGLLPGWWRFADVYRPEYALAGRTVWRRALADAGFDETAVLGAGRSGSGPAAVIVARAPAEERVRAGAWVLDARDGGLGAELARELERRGQRVIAPPAGGAPGREDWRKLFEGVPAADFRGVAYLGGCGGSGADAPPPELAADLERVGREALALTHGLLDAGASPRAGLWFVTRGGQSLADEPADEREAALSGSVLWGLGRTAARELGGLPVRLLDLEPGAPVLVEELASELLHAGRETEVLHRGGTRRVARLERPEPEPPVDGGIARVRGDRSYLVTGGLGGIGLRVADWLLGRGAGAVVLSGRRAPDAAAAEEVARLGSLGGEVRVEICDVTDGEAVDRLVSGIGAGEGPNAGLPPLGGVIHSVGVLADASLGNQDWSGFERVLGPKALGAWRLHRATLGLELELFVLFSSFAGLMGNAGQANHAAANTFLDRLALHRRSLGLPGQAIQWGAWSDLGEAEEARERIEARFEAAGTGWITPAEGIAALEQLVRTDVGCAAVGRMEWSALEFDEASRPALLDALLGDGQTPGSPSSSADLGSRVRAAETAAEREAVVVEFVRDEVRAILRLDAPPAPDVGFFDLGMDSLTAVELRTRLNRALAGHYAAPNSVVFDHPTIGKLARHLARELQGSAPERQPAPRLIRPPLPARRAALR